MRKIDDMQAWRIFCAAAQAGSLNAACEHLGIEPSTASRTLKAMEDEIGSPLFTRGARPARLTDFGRAAYERGQFLIDNHREMIESIQGENEAMSGDIRVAANPGLGPMEITPALIEYQTIYPSIQLCLRELRGPASRAFEPSLGLEAPVVDVAIGYGIGPTPPSGGIVRRYCGEMPFVACASPAYLQKHGSPEHPIDLRQHAGILLRTPARSVTDALVREGCAHPIAWAREHAFTSLSSAISALLLGAGVMPDLALHHFDGVINSGKTDAARLVRVLPGWQRPSASCYVFCSEQAWNKRRVRDFVEWIAARERSHLTNLRERYPDLYHGHSVQQAR